MALQSKQQLQHVGFFLTPSNSPYSPGQDTGVSSLSLLQGIFPIQVLNPGLPYCRQILYQLSHRGSPRILEWVAMPSSRGFSQSRDWTQVSHIAGRFFTSWATRDAPWLYSKVVELYTHTETYIYSFFYILFHYGLSYNIEYSSLYYTVGPCCLSTLYVISYIC